VGPRVVLGGGGLAESKDFRWSRGGARGQGSGTNGQGRSRDDSDARGL